MNKFKQPEIQDIKSFIKRILTVRYYYIFNIQIGYLVKYLTNNCIIAINMFMLIKQTIFEST